MKRVFISFRAGDMGKVDGLRLLAANDKFEVEFYDEPVRAPYDSDNADYIRHRIREKISRTSVTVCMMSPRTWSSKWVDWELQESISNGNSIICMGLKDGLDALVLPLAAGKLGLPWWGWDREWLGRLIDDPRLNVKGRSTGEGERHEGWDSVRS